MGIGPFQGGTIRDQTKLAGSQLKFGPRSATGSDAEFYERVPVDYNAEMRFDRGHPVFDHGGFGDDMLGPLDNIEFPDPNIMIAEEPEASGDGVVAEQEKIKR